MDQVALHALHTGPTGPAEWAMAEMLLDCLEQPSVESKATASSHVTSTADGADKPVMGPSVANETRVSLVDMDFGSTRSVLSVADLAGNFELTQSPQSPASLSRLDVHDASQKVPAATSQPSDSPIGTMESAATPLLPISGEDDNGASQFADVAPLLFANRGFDEALEETRRMPRLSSSSWGHEEDSASSSIDGIDTQLLSKATLDESLLLPALMYARSKHLNPLTDDQDRLISPRVLLREISTGIRTTPSPFGSAYKAASSGAVPVWTMENLPAFDQHVGPSTKPTSSSPPPQYRQGVLRPRADSEASSSSVASGNRMTRKRSQFDAFGPEDAEQAPGHQSANAGRSRNGKKHLAKKKRLSNNGRDHSGSGNSKTAKAPLVGEHRLKISFGSLGDLGEVAQHFGKKRCRIPDGLTGTHELYNQKWEFRVDHRRVHQEDGDVITINWRITNLASGSITERCETPHEAFIREYKGQTICNQVLRSALEARAKELEAVLHSRAGSNPRNNASLEASLRALRPRKCIMGLLFFGLLHQAVQDNLRRQASLRAQQ